MTDKGGFWRNWIVRNLIWALVFVIGLALVVTIMLSLVTQHNKEIVVPDFTNMTCQEAKYNAERVGLKVTVADSVFVRRMKKGAVFTQFPKGFVLGKIYFRKSRSGKINLARASASKQRYDFL